MNFKTSCCNLKVRGFGAKVCVAFLFNFERNYDVSKSKSHAFCWTKMKTLIKTKRNRKWKIPHRLLERLILCFSSYKSREWTVKLWWVAARERQKRAFFLTFILSEGHFFNICVLFQCIVYWLNFQNIHTFTYQKTILHTLFLLVFKTVESLRCIFYYPPLLLNFFTRLLLPSY